MRMIEHVEVNANNDLRKYHTVPKLIFGKLNPFPTPSYCGLIGSGEPLQSPLRPPGTDVKVGTESKGDGELPPSRWWSELTVIHTN